MKKLIYILVLIFPFSCLRLDSNLYNNSKVDAYKWDNYGGAVDFYTPSSYNIPQNFMNEITLVSKDTVVNKNYNIKALYIGNLVTVAQDTIILYCHGNRDHMDFYWPRAKTLANVGGKNRFGVFMFDYRGYGLSEGESTEESMNEDLTAALEWLKSKGVTSSKLVIYGFSLGSACSSYEMAYPRSSLKPSKLILENPFASAATMVADASRLSMPSSFFTNVKVDVSENIKRVNEPFMLLSSADDKFLKPSTHHDVVSANYKGLYKEVHSVPGADHGHLIDVWGLDNYRNTMEAFLLK